MNHQILDPDEAGFRSQRYFIKPVGLKEQEVTFAQFKRAELNAGFHPKSGNGLATAGFGNGSVSGRIEIAPVAAESNKTRTTTENDVPYLYIYEEGARAKQSGVPQEDNPYFETSRAGLSWKAGWLRPGMYIDAKQVNDGSD